ncbi:double zinc ribbon and ankyrin repeat-containing protein 1 isoform X3 [Sinocyclocheilus anshuiensis]|uniref:Double zinc ribbon and ankyrin repeat-containing protein 1 n=1 Tax=Sinocyclocheilus anshuiensis TaxID=1608454 RepID=A0A671N169_9TELE|nr:PREDICTED: double zinc ribbon and ankyrin repeat-containing protein 1 isoform X3 [Sinocyclocheilus anshuiensis]
MFQILRYFNLHKYSGQQSLFKSANMTAGSVAAPQIIPIRMPPPGKAKHEIDSCTAVEIKSESSDVSVLYTLDGSKPEMMKRPGFGDRTLKYTEAIRLPVGKVSVRAMAVSTDGRQSAVVTKVFIVAPSPSDEQDLTPGHEDDNLMNGRPINGKDDSLMNLKGSENGAGVSSIKSLDIPSSESRRALKGPRFLSQRLGPGSSTRLTVQNTQVTNRSADGESLLKNLTSTQISRVQRETDFLRCPKCLSHRPSDPFARFCLHCGAPVPPIPGQRLPPTEGGQMGLCVHCKTMVPLNTATCVVCESPLTQQLQPQASLRLQDKLICHSCGTGNPAHITHCVTCESQLLQQTTPVLSGQRAAPVPSSQGKMVSCSKCNRVNHSDARFCDWCGAKPGHKASSVTCSQCGASSHPYANYCGGCGVFLDGPPRTPSHVNQGQDAQEADQSSATWQAVPAPESTTVPPAAGLRMCADAQTQTVGLFFPSSSELKKRSQQREAELSRQEQMSDRKPLLTAVSPGRGYWRKQLDHICAHLRSYTQNNTEFRALIGEPRLGRMISAVIQEDSYEVSLRINFISASPEGSRSSSAGQQSRSVASESQNLSAVTEGRNSASLDSNINTEVSSVNRKKQKKIWSSDTTEKQPESKDSLLLKEVGPEGRGQISAVQQLLDEGADPACLGSDGRPALVAAALNGHHDVIPVLVQREADVNQASGPLNNTALHEAAALGNQGLRSVEILLGCNASIRKQNNRGQTAYDIAVAAGSSSAVSLMAAHMGQELLQHHTKARSPSGLDTFS